MDIQEIEQKIRTAVEAQRAKGTRVGVYPFVTDDRTGMCPLACVLAEADMLPEDDGSFTDPVEQILGVPNGWAWDFVSGFDRRISLGFNEAERLGVRIRQYVDGKAP